ncbi:MAG: DNA-binding protein WhiA [Lachnospiraceae bacterium]|nr:DNA-binding protein WhiA [Lachnospiraceae bacterium]
MSFAKDVKEELFKHIGLSRHCQLAELSALITYSGADISKEAGDEGLVLDLENAGVAGKCFTLLVKTFNIFRNVDEKQCLNGTSLTISGQEEIRMLRQALLSDVLLQKSCCMRAYLRGAFLASGSVSDPEKSYHFEIVCRNKERAEVLKDILKHFDINAKDIIRKDHNVVYIKEGALIVEALNVMEAHVALMDYENSRILKEMRNSLNRRVNCETANIGKTVTASVKQTEDIRTVMGMPEYKSLPYGIRQIAELRLQYPDASLKELGQMCDPPVGKSGVNHRLRKIGEIRQHLGGEHYEEKRNHHSA